MWLRSSRAETEFLDGEYEYQDESGIAGAILRRTHVPTRFRRPNEACGALRGKVDLKEEQSAYPL